MLRALHSLTGLVPVGVFMFVQLWLHARALDGPAAHAEAMALLNGDGAAIWQWFVIMPLCYHAVYGIVLIARPRYNIRRYPFSRNWNYTLQRVTGIVALVFIIYHATTVSLQLQLGRLTAADMYELLVNRLSTTSGGVPWIAVGYLIGLAACSFHLANGLWTFCYRWGLTRTRSARDRAGWAFALVGVASFVFGANTVLHFATGWSVTSTAKLEGSGPTYCDPQPLPEASRPRPANPPPKPSAAP